MDIVGPFSRRHNGSSLQEYLAKIILNLLKFWLKYAKICLKCRKWLQIGERSEGPWGVVTTLRVNLDAPLSLSLKKASKMDKTRESVLSWRSESIKKHPVFEIEIVFSGRWEDEQIKMEMTRWRLESQVWRAPKIGNYLPRRIKRYGIHSYTNLAWCD